MKKIRIDNNNGIINVVLLKGQKTVQIDMNKEGCKMLIEELTRLSNDQQYFMDYDNETGVETGVLVKDSLGIILSRWDKIDD